MRAAAIFEEQRFQNLRVRLALIELACILMPEFPNCALLLRFILKEKRAVLEEKLQKLSISLREDRRIAKRARYQVPSNLNWVPQDCPVVKIVVSLIFEAELGSVFCACVIENPCFRGIFPPSSALCCLPPNIPLVRLESHG